MALYTVVAQLLETARLHSARAARNVLESTTSGDSWRRQTTTLLNKFGFRRLGSGARGVAYGHPTYPYIIKAYRNDRGFEAWMQFVRTHQSNAYVPRLRGKNIRIGDTVFVRMERLQPLAISGWAWNTATEFRYAYELLLKYSDNVQAGMTTMGVTRRRIVEDRIAEIESDSDLHEILTFFYAHPTRWLDLHMGNWMTRGADELVIIDPLYARR